MCSPLLEGCFQTPALHEIADDLFGGLGLVSGKQGFGWARSLRVAGEDPPNGQGNGSKAIPASGATTELQRALAFPIPVQGEALPHRLRIMQEVLYRGQSFAHDRGTPQGMLAAHWRWLVDHRVEAKRGNQGELLLSA